MRHYPQLFGATLTTSLMLVAVAGAAVAGPLEDSVAAVKRGDYVTALRLFRPLADQGDDVAQFDLGVIYNKGWGVPRDYVQASKWYRLAAAQGNADAQYNLGILNDDGHRHAEVVKWYRKAADQGDAQAQFNLGVMYGDGQGVPQDYVTAHMWLNLSAAHGYADAIKNRDRVAQRMTPSQIVEAQKLAREWKPKPER